MTKDKVNYKAELAQSQELILTLKNQVTMLIIRNKSARRDIAELELQLADNPTEGQVVNSYLTKVGRGLARNYDLLVMVTSDFIDLNLVRRANAHDVKPDVEATNTGPTFEHKVNRLMEYSQYVRRGGFYSDMTFADFNKMKDADDEADNET